MGKPQRVEGLVPTPTLFLDPFSFPCLLTHVEADGSAIYRYLDREGGSHLEEEEGAGSSTSEKQWPAQDLAEARDPALDQPLFGPRVPQQVRRQVYLPTLAPS